MPCSGWLTVYTYHNTIRPCTIPICMSPVLFYPSILFFLSHFLSFSNIFAPSEDSISLSALCHFLYICVCVCVLLFSFCSFSSLLSAICSPSTLSNKKNDKNVSLLPLCLAVFSYLFARYSLWSLSLYYYYCWFTFFGFIVLSYCPFFSYKNIKLNVIDIGNCI